MWHIKTYGRQTIYAPYTEEQFLSLKGDELYKAVIEIIEQSKGIHLNNHRDSVYLKRYLYGDQDIYRDKQKLTRPEIDNKTVENWAYAIIDFKKTYLLGKPIQYVQINDSSEEEISALNAYVRYENKKAKDLLIYEDVLTCGRGFRYVNKDGEKLEDEAPFEIINCPVENTEVVYSNALGKKQLFAYIVTDMQDVVPVVQENGTIIEELQEFEEYTVYTRDLQFVINNKYGDFKLIGEPIPLLNKVHRIVEYYINEKRIGLIELGKDLFNDINYLESLDKDDMEQFVNAIMVFVNAEVSAKELGEIRELGAVCINSTDQKKASIELLQGRLNATDTQTYYNRLLSALHQILGVPMASDTGSVTYGDTGKAKLTGQGYTSAGIRAEGDETMFGMCDLKSLNTILAICRSESGSLIKNLKVSQLDARFQRDMSDNLLVKTQALMNLYSADVPRKYANEIIGLFGDSSAVTADQYRLFGEQISQLSQKTSTNNADTTNDVDKATKQNKDIQNSLQLDLQEQ